ncbi:uncharacterized protein PGTG_07288 [Puccinia graminis f. sp. tritici CRL 75-36-700-3]|uniref:Uncharacterized protein n=1 Tax=Puccinia graminis f. sp. tritici (strain CRL 75-36-700-3 / race SCCL) TaxID=418459 RepID=E3K986_PUCGT|nr:uncharacterized protein PGTG_07288 [Puccinia graminis f. sp. tritici CRL 75-36-700-3]EFP81036.2 hypothetical protein PGTG_07288 [Puccinia graminis f. sp. tritici CRL 75-36-700-3]
MNQVTQELIKFLTSLPASTNPYEATAVKIKQETEEATPVLWGLILRRIIAFQFFVLCCQAAAVLYLRKKAKKLHFFRYNKLGLIHVEVLNEIVLLMLVFSLMAFVDLFTQEFTEKNLLRLSSIETALNLSSLGARARAGASIRLSAHLRFALNGSLVTLMVVPGALLLWISILVARSLRIIETNTDGIVATLIETAPSYRAETYSYLSVLRLLKPMASTLEIATRLNRYTKIVLLLYLLQHLLIAIVYLPISVIALRGLRKRAVPKDLLQRGSVQICTPTHQDTIDKVRKRLINHALLIYLQEILYCPTLVYMVRILLFSSSSSSITSNQVGFEMVLKRTWDSEHSYVLPQPN